MAIRKDGKESGAGRSKCNKEMQEKYAEARVNGARKSEAIRIAGYSENSPPSIIEREGGPVRNRIIEKLNERGIDEAFLANEYVESLLLAKQLGARDRDLNATAQLLKQLGFLLGYTNKTPSVAVQINNTTSPVGRFDPGTVAELARLLREEIASRDSGGVHEGSVGDGYAGPHTGVDTFIGDARQIDSGGGEGSR